MPSKPENSHGREPCPAVEPIPWQPERRAPCQIPIVCRSRRASRRRRRIAHLSAIACCEDKPCFRRARLDRSNPSGVRGPVLPCSGVQKGAKIDEARRRNRLRERPDGPAGTHQRLAHALIEHVSRAGVLNSVERINSLIQLIRADTSVAVFRRHFDMCRHLQRSRVSSLSVSRTICRHSMTDPIQAFLARRPNRWRNATP
jgi:hypothetical protein